MKNKLFVLVLLLAITIPQVAAASWWNPLSWKVFSKFRQPKVEMVQTATSTNEMASTTDEQSEIEKLRAEVEELKKNHINQEFTNQATKTQTKTETTSTQKPTTASVPVVTQTTKTISRDELFADLINKYTDFQTVVTNERNGLKKNSLFYTEKQYFQFMDNLLTAINADLGYLVGIKNWTSRPSGIEEIYLSKFNKLNNDYNIESKRYKSEYSQELDSKTREAMVDYIKLYKYRLYEASIHVEAAGLLYEFDKIYGSNYTKDFESKKTQVETVEFANRFLIDQE